MLYPKFDYQKAMPTPWGKADSKYLITKGVYEVTTPGHGGILVGKAVARKLLSPKAIACGFPWASYYAFEEDCDWSAFVYEQPEIYTKAWSEHNPITSKENPEKYTAEAVKADAMESLKRWHEDYFI